MKEKEINYIKNNIPRYMLPGFVSIINTYGKEDWFSHFIHIYHEFVVDATEKGVPFITPSVALTEYMKKNEEVKHEPIKEVSDDPTEDDISDALVESEDENLEPELVDPELIDSEDENLDPEEEPELVDPEEEPVDII